MADEKDRFGDTMKLVERAKEDIYFAQHDRELIEKLKAQLQKADNQELKLHCPKCPGLLETHTFHGFALDRCQNCGGIWMDKGELEGVIRKLTRGPLVSGSTNSHPRPGKRSHEMKSGVKKYNTAYKKRVLERDTYLPLLSPKGIIQCSGCGAFYYRRHWTLNPPSGFSYPVHAHPIYCAACRKIRDRFPGAELHLLGVEAGERGEIVRIMRNEEQRAREKNPLERIMRLQEAGGNWKVETTTEKLAQRLGRSIKKARGGNIAYKWGHNNKFVRVVWEKRAE